MFGEGVVSNHQRHERPPLFSDEPHPNGFDSPLPLYGNLRGGSRHLYNEFGAHIHNLIGGSQVQASCQTIKDKLVRTKSQARVSNETLEQGALK